jgi:hypothetical protein
MTESITTPVSSDTNQNTGETKGTQPISTDIQAILKEMREQTAEKTQTPTVSENKPEAKAVPESKPESKPEHKISEAEIAKTLESWKQDYENNLKSTLIPKFKSAEEKMQALEQEVYNLKVSNAVAAKLTVLKQAVDRVIERHQLNDTDYVQFTEYLRARGISDPQAIEDIADGLAVKGFWKKPQLQQSAPAAKATEPTIPQSPTQVKTEFNYRDRTQRREAIASILRQTS